MTAQAILSPDRRSVRVSLSPVFNSVNRLQAVPVVTNPVLPGAP